MKSIKEFENFKVEGLKYFTGGGDPTGGGTSNTNGTCTSWNSDHTYNDGETVRLNEKTVKCEK